MQDGVEELCEGILDLADYLDSGRPSSYPGMLKTAAATIARLSWENKALKAKVRDIACKAPKGAQHD